MNKNNYSTAADVAMLVSECMKIDVYRKVVGTVTFECLAGPGSSKTEDGKLNKYKWENSNKLLGKLPGILGCKTGITTSAGPCFAGYYEKGNTKLAIILCHSKTMDHRWEEIKILVQWYLKHKQVRAPQKSQVRTQDIETLQHIQNIKKIQANMLRL